MRETAARLRQGLLRRFRTYNGTERAFYGLAVLSCAVGTALVFGDCGLPRPWGWLLTGLLGAAAGAAALVLGSLLLRLLLRRGPAFLLCTAALTGLVGSCLYESCRGNVPLWGAELAALGMVVVVRSFVQSLWAVLAKKQRGAFPLCGLILSAALTLAISIFLFLPGFDDGYVDDYLLLDTVSAEEGELLRTGRYEAACFYYGTGEEGALASGQVDLGPFVGGYRGLQAWYRELVQGYNIWNVPLQGKVWYPVGGEVCPLLVIAHGNHNLTTPSYEGYDYLARELAEKGYVVASIDCNACNWCVFGNLSGENDGRAVLMLEHIRQLLRYAAGRDNPLYGMVDRRRIAVAGHSRGGESAAIAALFCTLDRLPGNGNITFDWNFSIRSVIAIAPTADQYNPAGHTVELADVNYLLLQGANDQDVSVFMGARQYENVSFTGEQSALKSSLYIAGANHSQFNTTWGRWDLTGPVSLLLNVENLLTASEQQDILCTFASVFLDVTLRGDKHCRDLLYDCGAYGDHLPKTVYVQSYEDSGFDLLADFEENADLSAEDGGQVELRVTGASTWQESVAYYANSAMDDGSGMGTYVLNVNWKPAASAQVLLRFRRYDGTGRCLQFDLADTDEAAVAAGVYESLDAAVTVTDLLGHEATVRLRDYCTVYPPLPVILGKLQGLVGEEEYKAVFQTCRIPLAALQAAEPLLDVTRLIAVTLTFDDPAGGSVSLDNVGFAGD